MASAGEPPEADEPPEDTEGRPRRVPLAEFLQRYKLAREPRTRPFDIPAHKEITASQLALGLLIVFGVTLVIVLVYAFIEDKDGAVDLARTILPFTGTPLALALGYYFGVSAR